MMNALTDQHIQLSSTVEPQMILSWAQMSMSLLSKEDCVQQRHFIVHMLICVMMAEFYLAASASGSWWSKITLSWRVTAINVIGNPCTFRPMN